MAVAGFAVSSSPSRAQGTAIPRAAITETKVPHLLSNAEVYVTARSTSDRITRQEPVAFESNLQPDEHIPTIILDRNKTFQTIIGIGGALTDASAETFYKMPEAKQNEMLTALFDRTKGNGFSLCRTNIHSCDFSSDGYTYDESEGDTALAQFTIAHDLRYRVPFIKGAMRVAGPDFRLYASPWSPPAWMKTNNSMLRGGKLRNEYAGTWARYFTRFVREYQKCGIPIWGLTVQNEPMAVQTWESCIFTATEERDFVKNYLGPELERAGMSSLKLMIWDHNRGIMYQRAQATYDDPGASKYVWGMAYHWYVGDHFDNVRLVHDSYPDKALVFTEGSEGNFNADSVTSWRWGEIVGRSMIADLNNWAAGWDAWNVILDERGGPNHLNNYCMAPIICNTKTGEVTYTSSFYYLGHFSRFIRPGAKRIICSSNDDSLQATAFLNADGTLAVVVMNASDRDIPFLTWIENQAVKSMSRAHSIVTLVL